MIKKILKHFNIDFFLNKHFYKSFSQSFFSYIKKYLEKHPPHITKKTKKRFKNGLVKDIKILLKKKKTKSENMVVNDKSIFQKIKNKG